MTEEKTHLIDSIKICHDSRRTTGHWYASVHLTQTIKTYSAEKDPKNLSRPLYLEIILNGPGKSKARKKYIMN